MMAGAQFIPAASPEAQLRGEELGLLRQLDRQVCLITHSETIAILDRLEAKGEAHFWADADHQLWGDITAKGRKALPPALATLRAI